MALETTWGNDKKNMCSHFQKIKQTEGAVNLVDKANKKWYAVEEHHGHQDWRAMMILSVLKFGMWNAWVYCSRVVYANWIAWRKATARLLMFRHVKKWLVPTPMLKFTPPLIDCSSISEQGILYKNRYKSHALYTCVGVYSSVLSPCILLRRWGDKNKDKNKR